MTISNVFQITFEHSQLVLFIAISYLLFIINDDCNFSQETFCFYYKSKAECRVVELSSIGVENGWVEAFPVFLTIFTQNSKKFIVTEIKFLLVLETYLFIYKLLLLLLLWIFFNSLNLDNISEIMSKWL